MLPFLVRLAASAKCQTIGNFQGSEDATLYRAGFAFQSSGLVPGTGQPGLILGLSLAGATPAATPLELLDVPDGFGFRPHGLHFDNVRSAWQVSTSLVYGTHVVLGSPWDVDPVACEHPR